MKKILKWVAIFFVGLLILGFILGDDDATNTASETVKVDENESAISVTAAQLYNAYANNEVAADKQFKGKLLEIVGTIESINSGMSDQAVLELATGEMFMTVSAEGDDNFTDIASTLSKGQQVQLICRGAGEIIGVPFLDKCVFQ